MNTSLLWLAHVAHGPRLWIGYGCAIALLLALRCWKHHSPKRSHQWRIKSATNALKQLQLIGRERGPAAQFSYLRRIDCFVFEEAVLTAIAAAGHTVKRNNRYTGDGGLDGECWIDGQRILLQMKRYAKHVNRQHVMAFAVLCRDQRARGVFVHTGRTGRGTRTLADDTVTIISGSRLLACLGVDDITAIEAWRSILRSGSTRKAAA